MNNSQQNRSRAVAAVPTAFWAAFVVLSIFWFQEIVRAANDIFLPSLGMLLAIVVALIFCSKALARDVTVSSCWAYGVVCLLLLFLTVIQVVYKVNTPLEGVLPAKKAITALLSDFSLRNIYALLVDSWMLIILHVGALICGVASIYLAIKHA